MDGRLRRLVDASEAIVFFGGAGVSCESGIPDFRSTDGLYHQEYRWPPEEILSHDFFERRPEEFFRFYRDKMLYPQAEPNAAHLALARLEQAGKLKAVVTQNIDGLHQAAGSKNVLELHGSVHRNHCTRCGAFYTLDGVLRSEGKGAYEALTAATRSRIVPVAMASGTTILGMLPLLFDSMFGAMAATIMGGLLVATLLTVCVLPVVYAIFYNIRKS